MLLAYILISMRCTSEITIGQYCSENTLSLYFKLMVVEF